MGVLAFGDGRGGEGLGGFPAFGVRIAVYGDVGEVAEEPGGAVFAGFEGEELGVGVDEARGGFAGAEDGVRNNVFEEGNVGFDAPDAELAEGSVHAVEALLVAGA